MTTLELIHQCIDIGDYETLKKIAEQLDVSIEKLIEEAKK